MKYLYLFIGMTLFIWSPSKAQEFIIFKGKITGPSDNQSVYMYNNLLKVNDSAKIVNGAFEIKVPFTQPSRYLFFTSYDINVKKGYAPFGVLIDRPLTVNIDLNIEEGFSKSKVSNSPPHAIYEEYLLNRESKDEKWKVDFILRHKDSYASVFLLDRFGDDFNLENKELSFSNLGKKLQTTIEGEKVKANILGKKNAVIGKEIADFVLQGDQEGVTHSLKSLRGKYVLIDFWASWCVPCIQSFPKLKTIYETYKPKGFEILAVSIDKDHKSWIKAIQQHSLPWVQVIDSPRENNVALSKFAVTAVPTTFLVDPNGVLVAKSLSHDELVKFLEDNLN